MLSPPRPPLRRSSLAHLCNRTALGLPHDPQGSSCYLQQGLAGVAGAHVRRGRHHRQESAHLAGRHHHAQGASGSRLVDEPLADMIGGYAGLPRKDEGVAHARYARHRPCRVPRAQGRTFSLSLSLSPGLPTLSLTTTSPWHTSTDPLPRDAPHLWIMHPPLGGIQRAPLGSHARAIPIRLPDVRG